MTAGHFSSPNVIDIAAGAPQHGGNGKVEASSFVLFPAAELKASCVACYSDFVFLLHRFTFSKSMACLW